MQRLHLLLAWSAAILFVVEARAEEGLFSTIALESAFADGPDHDVTAKPSPTASRVTGARSLVHLLNEKGYQAERIAETGVETALKYDGLVLPAVLQVKIDQDRIAIAVLLAKLEQNEDRTSEQWRKLLAQVDDGVVGHFAYDAETRRIELRSFLSNRGLTAESLHKRLLSLARWADRRYASWSLAGESKPSSLRVPTGSWVASVSRNEAFAVRFTSAGRFSLVHTKNGKSTVSTGRAALSRDQLTLSNTQGVKLVGTLSQQTSLQFQLTIGERNLLFNGP